MSLRAAPYSPHPSAAQPASPPRTDPTPPNAPPALGLFLQWLGTELRIQVRRRSEALAALLFFIMVATLFPFALGSQPDLLRAVGPGVIWVAALLSVMLAQSRLFSDEWQEGSLEQWLLQARAPWLGVMARVTAQWLTSGFAITLMAPLMAMPYAIDADQIGVLMLSLLLGTPLLSLLGALAAALTLGVRQAGLLVALVMLPLTVPVLVFGAGAVGALQAGLDAVAHLSLLAALLLVGAPLLGGAVVWALQISIRQ